MNHMYFIIFYIYDVMISMDISIFTPMVFCSQFHAGIVDSLQLGGPVLNATKAKRRMEEERMGKLEKYREDYEVRGVIFFHVVPFKGMPGDIFPKLG